ncbi:HEAT repeat domain-containing protein [Streptomyces sp. G45]|uniref:HEAT repeat domain-containing protein n=1 Tax=Streptomyces sp. G45 TaxID=3406627 RepID=UPI003C292D27
MLTSPDQEVFEDAIWDLYDHVLNVDTVSPATVPAVPFIARLAAAGVRSPALLYMLGRIAAADHADDGSPDEAHAAVVTQLPLLLPMLTHDDAEVRQLAVWVVAQCRGSDLAPKALWARWREERHASVRADLVFALALLDPARATGMAAGLLTSAEPDKVRIAAVAVSLRLGGAWTDEARDTVLSLLPVGDRFGESPWIREPLVEIVHDVAERGDIPQAIEMLEIGLKAVGLTDPAARDELLLAAKSVGDEVAETRARMLPVLLPLLKIPDESQRVMRYLRAWSVFG